MKSRSFYHLMAIFTATVWGVTFVSSKVLLEAGFTPALIMVIRFVIAYGCLLPFWRGKIFCDTVRDELMMVALGITGGSLYFLLENSALLYTQASNVAIIIAATPLLTTLAVQFISRQERASKRFYAYSLLAMAGVALVVFNGEFILKLNPLGDLLTLGASVMWVIYSILILKMEGHYHPLMITRKIFLYGVLTLAPYLIVEGCDITWAVFREPVVVGNLLFLGVVASLICYWAWNVVLEKLGAIKATNYLYLNPIVALITSWLVLSERITALAIVGTALILVGMYMAQKK